MFTLFTLITLCIASMVLSVFTTVVGTTTVDTVVSIINNVGFPIAICCGLIYLMVTQNKTHKEDNDKIRIAIENNTIIITKLCEKLDKESEGK